MAEGNRASGSTWHGSVAPCDHAVHIYKTDEAFVAALERYVADGLTAGDGVVVVATAAHRETLEQRLEARGVNLESARRRDQYIAVDAEHTLSQFMVDAWPDERLFESVVSTLVSRARGRKNRRVRAFGEMVVLLWNGGHHGATVRLEHLWRRICQLHSFALLCAYPKDGFSEHTNASLLQICATHTHVIEG
ncbi:MAG TPA: MEDS domain-containing protein [Candidatus Saccharimonadia bacterium]|nr:MEDS domain-containing protein [Candidatus Saccharimonadia bacterium]